MTAAKPSPIAVESDLPEGWTRACLPEIARINMGQSPPGSTYNEMGRGLPFYQGKADFGSCFPTVRVWCTEPNKVARPGDVLISVRAPVGPTNIANCDCAIGRGLAALTPLAGIPTEFLLFALRQQEPELALSGTGSTFAAISKTDLETLEIDVPPLAEQKRIVKKAGQLLARVNAARERLTRVPAILKRFRQAVLAACSGRLTADWRGCHTPSETAESLLNRILGERKGRYEAACEEEVSSGGRKPRLPKNLTRREIATDYSSDELPDTWLWVAWDDLVDWITYGFTRPMPHVEEGVPIVTAKNVLDGTVDFSTADHTTKRAFAELSEKDRPRKGEILLTKDGSIGRAAIVDTDLAFCVNQSVAVLRFGGLTAHVPYLLRAIQAPFTQRLIEEGSEGTAIPHISITTFGTFPIPLPPLDEQREIDRRVEALFKLADAIEGRVAAATARAEKLTQSILAKAFRGELVLTEAELSRREGRPYEPASALLAGVRSRSTCASHLRTASRRRLKL